jgi:hypothetical protein
LGRYQRRLKKRSHSTVIKPRSVRRNRCTQQVDFLTPERVLELHPPDPPDCGTVELRIVLAPLQEAERERIRQRQMAHLACGHLGGE